MEHSPDSISLLSLDIPLKLCHLDLIRISILYLSWNGREAGEFPAHGADLQFWLK
jgi:hypothetical protein